MGIGSPGRPFRTCIAIGAALLAWAAPARAGELVPAPTAPTPAPVVEAAASVPLDTVAGAVAAAPSSPPVTEPAPPAPPPIALPVASAPAVPELVPQAAPTPPPPPSTPRPEASPQAAPAVHAAAVRAAHHVAPIQLSTSPSRSVSRIPAVRPDEASKAVDTVRASIAADRVSEAPSSPALPGRASGDCTGFAACGGTAGSGAGSTSPTALLAAGFVLCAVLLCTALVVISRRLRGFSPLLLLERPG
jgi:hypothetical protein